MSKMQSKDGHQEGEKKFEVVVLFKMREENPMSIGNPVEILEIIGISFLIAFTLVTTAIAIRYGGACVYYCEPNGFIWITEVIAGIYGILVGLFLISKHI